MRNGPGRVLLSVVLVLAMLSASCDADSEPGGTTTTTVGTTTTTTEPPREDPGFYLNLVWHQHQPFYPKDADGVYTRPWVRVHATKDYHDMAALVAEYPNVTATFNLTPVLLLQLEDLANGAKDVYWTTAEIPADELDDAGRRFVLERFFDVNSRIVDRFPRFRELADSRAELGVDGALESWEDRDFRDLQVLFNLAWTDPSFLAEDPLAGLVAKGEDFTEEDKEVLFTEHLRIVQATIPLHAELWEAGEIEVTTTPLAHPILPLVADTALAAVGDPAAILPDDRFQEIPDADEHVIRGLRVAERLLGRTPVGMWPGEGSVAQLVMSLFSKNGVRWVASGEEVLAKTLDIGSFTRDSSDLVTAPELLYRPYAAQLRRNDPVAMFFRDGLLSDLIGFEYSGSGAEAAADDFMRRLRSIRDALEEQERLGGDRPPVVSVILDGENAWEHYENDGIDFLRALYSRLDSADWVWTTTPTRYLERFGDPEPVGDVWPGAWFQPNFATWIGEAEEATAWDYLYRTRQDLDDLADEVSETAYAAAYETMLFAEGSDWFWWYGSDQDSGNDSYFDQAFRELLGQVYDALGVDRPGFVDVPIIPEPPVAPTAAAGDLLTPVLGDAASWEGAGRYVFDTAGGIEEVRWAFDREAFYLRAVGDVDRLVAYLGAPEGDRTPVALDGSPLGFGSTHLLRFGDPCTIQAGQSDPVAVACALRDGALDVVVPLEVLGALEPGDTVLAKVESADIRVPATGPMGFQVPDISNVDVFLDVEDPVGDDHGPGTYAYPTDGVFAAGSYDLTSFQVGTEDDEVVFTFEVLAAIQNPWGSPRGLSIQTFDVYVDTDPGAGTGARLLIPGRNAALADGVGWEYGITIEGWEPAIYVAGSDGTVEETRPSFDVVVFGDKGKVVARIPRSLFEAEGDPADWGYAAAVMSQEGYPSTGVRRIRDVEGAAQQWRLGGAPSDLNHTRIVDVASAVPGEQEELLSSYPSVTSGSVDELGPDDFGTLPLLTPS